jgi:hypothetical protein
MDHQSTGFVEPVSQSPDPLFQLQNSQPPHVAQPTQPERPSQMPPPAALPQQPIIRRSSLDLSQARLGQVDSPQESARNARSGSHKAASNHEPNVAWHNYGFSNWFRRRRRNAGVTMRKIGNYVDPLRNRDAKLFAAVYNSRRDAYGVQHKISVDDAKKQLALARAQVRQTATDDLKFKTEIDDMRSVIHNVIKYTSVVKSKEYSWVHEWQQHCDVFETNVERQACQYVTQYANTILANLQGTLSSRPHATAVASV